MKRFALALLALGIAVSAMALFLQASRLYVDGDLASSGVIERNGTVYVPLRDVAGALKMTLQKTSRGYELTTAGGANQINGVEGKIGDVLWNGYARFSVVKVVRGTSYTNQFAGTSEVVTPPSEGQDVVAIVCRLKNGTKESVTAELPAGVETALTDTKGNSYTFYSGTSIDCPSRGQKLLPGAGVDFALTYFIPHDVTLKDFVYQANFFENQNSTKKKFRVALQ